MITRIVEYTNEDFYGYDNGVSMEYEIEPTTQDLLDFIYNQTGIKMDTYQLQQLEKMLDIDIDDAIDCDDEQNEDYMEFLKDRYYYKAEKEYD